mgnify:CR=1 FL=1
MTNHKPKKRSVTVSGHRTSVSIENEFWREFIFIAKRKKISVNRLISNLDHSRERNLSSAIRVFVLNEIKKFDQ